MSFSLVSRRKVRRSLVNANANPTHAQRRVVLITGCSAGGIGHHLALEFAAQGWQVYASARNLHKLDEKQLREYGVSMVELDVTSDASVEAAVSRVVRETGGTIDMLVNNAGQSCVGPTVEVGLDRVQQLFDVNFTGTVRLCQVVAPYMMDRRQGTIVNVGSVSAYAATPWVGHYAASKAAVHAFSDSLRVELAPFGVHVVVLAPGSVKSNLVDRHLEREGPVSTNSRYRDAWAAIREKSQLGRADGSEGAAFARKVVPGLSRAEDRRGRSPAAYVTQGRRSAAAWLVYFVPPAIRDPLFARRFGTRKLAQVLEHQQHQQPFQS
ncbi:NADPH-dependent 1-acyl dihydroxyacetone phosphate reductase [Coemansia sp. Benny D115]|nr:NADPH-dependent 1-acyl dihydroxyacetone phosphate reductase [Coemansia sp. Benny D115]